MKQHVHFIVTAGPTREYLDPVRFLSNPSTGRMGFAVARAARRAGPPPADLFAADHRLAARAASESCVLLKNENGVLPLRRQGQRIAVIGHMALHPRIQGGGSSRVNSRAVTSLLGELDSRRIAYAYAEGCLADGSTNEELLTAAKEAAASSESSASSVSSAACASSRETPLRRSS